MNTDNNNVKCMVMQYSISSDPDGYKYNISIGMTELYLNNKKATVKLLKLLGKDARLYSCAPNGNLRMKQLEWQNEA